MRSDLRPAAGSDADAALGLRLRYAVVVTLLLAAFAIVGGQLIRLGLAGQSQTAGGRPIRIAVAETLTRSSLRPDIVDRAGRLIATDVPAPSIFVDPQLVIDVDEVVDRLTERFRDIDPAELRAQIADRAKRFVWIRRGVSPKIAQAILDLGLPGVQFRTEMRRAFPQDQLASHLIGAVGADNQGLGGVEGLIDERRAQGELKMRADGTPEPIRLTIDLGVQYGLEAELADAMWRHGAKAAAGVLIDVTNGDIIAAGSLPAPDPKRPLEAQDRSRIDRLAVGAYELGSIFKVFTVALAIDRRIATPDTIVDVRQPLTIAGRTIRDLHPAGRPLSVREVFIQSSNVGSGMLALEAGPTTVRSFLGQLGLLTPLRWDLGRITPPIQPRRWGRLETATVAFGHGIAIAPLQFAVAAAALVNGGTTIEPAILLDRPHRAAGDRVITTETSATVAELMRRNVTAPKGTGRRAAVAGLEIGGKTGTAEIPGAGGYQRKSVIASFLAVFPASHPRYALLAMVFEPKATDETNGEITAGIIAAPLAGRIIERAAPLLEAR